MQKIDLKNIKNKKVVAIGAHPDDVEFGAGGTLLQLGKVNEVRVIVVSDGQMGSHDVDEGKGELVVARQKEQLAAAVLYDAKQVVFFDLMDTKVGEEKKRLVKKLVKRLVRWQPDVVITHDPWKHYFPYHADHVAVGLAVLDAVLLATLPGYLKKVGPVQPMKARPTVWLMHPQERQLGIDISGVWEQKLELLQKFTSQFDEQVQWEEIKDKLTKQAEEMGKELGVKYAEAFAEISHSAFSGVED